MSSEAARVDDFRAEFPVLSHAAYLNAGTDGPIPRRAADAAAARLQHEVEHGRSGEPHTAELGAMRSDLRERLAALLGCAVDELALTRSTTDGINTVLSGLELGPADEVLTSDEEHPGLLAPLAAAGRRRGFSIRYAPFGELAGQVKAATRLIACSHVSWVNGRVVDTEALAATDALVLLDGAQGIGAVPVDIGALGCDFYAASGQKWLCGPDASGCLYVRRALLDSVAPSWPGYETLADPGRAAELPYHPGAARFDTGIVPGPGAAWSLAALELLAAAGWPWIHARGAELAAELAELLSARGLEVAPRGPSTLVSWRADDPEAEVERLAAAGLVVRHLPGRGLVRASVGAWSTERELEQLAALAAR